MKPIVASTDPDAHPHSAPAIVWFREDLRLADNPALAAAVKTGRPLVLLYIHDEESSGLRTRGGASKWWLGKSLAEHARRIEKAGGRLAIRVGAAKDVLNDVVALSARWIPISRQVSSKTTST